MSRIFRCLQLLLLAIWALLVVPAIGAARTIDFWCDELEMEYPGDENYYCSVSAMDIDHDTQINCDVYATHRHQVHNVKFYTSRMLFIPFGLFRYFSGIRDLDISDSTVVDISRNTFEDANELLYLSVAHNNLTELAASIFTGAHSLYLLNVSHNHISHINRYAFSGISKVSRIDLSHNRLSSVEPTLFHDLVDLDRIDLNDNQLGTIDNNQFASNRRLRAIVLDNNALVELNPMMFSHNGMLESLQVSRNALQEINATAFPSAFRVLMVNNNALTKLTVANLEDVDASNNHIRSLVIAGTPNTLKRLRVANNSLTNITNIAACVNLEILDVSSNRITNIIPTVSGMKLLTQLNLAQTSLADLDYGVFSAQRSLKTLDISYNNLSAVHLDFFSPYLTRLESLFIEGNNLTEIGGIFQLNLSTVFPVLYTVGLSNNAFNCTYLTQLYRLLTPLHIELTIDPDLSAARNTTHVFGIACTNNKTSGPTRVQRYPDDAAAYNQFVASHHLHHQRLAIQDVANRNKLDAMFNHNDHELRTARQQLDRSQVHEELLLANLRTMKCVIGIVAVVGLAVLAMKCVTFYRQNRELMPSMTGSTLLYRSTTTMNTLQSSVEAGA